MCAINCEDCEDKETCELNITFIHGSYKNGT